MRLKKILFPTDFSETADHALDQAVELAVAHGASLHVFHAVLLHTEDPRHLRELLADYVERVEREALEALETKSRAIQERGIDVEIATERSVSPWEAILDKEREIRPDLVVMGTHGRTGLGKLLLGSVAEKVLRYAKTNVMTVRRDATVFEADKLDHALVAVDFTDYSRRALEAAQALVTKRGRITLVHVVSSPIHPSFYAGGVTRLFQIDPGLPARIEAKLAEWLGDRRGEIVVTEGDVATEILRIVDERKPQLVAVGTRGLTGVDHFLVGSVAEKIVRSAKVPVLTVK